MNHKRLVDAINEEERRFLYSINHARTGHSPSHRLVAVALGVVARLPIFGRRELAGMLR